MTSSPDTKLPCTWAPSPNFTARRPETDPPRCPDILVLHYTAMASAERALYWLTTEQSQVSCHYLVDEKGKIFQTVREADRAWQAGVSFWQGDLDINSASIGIEIHNGGPDCDAPGFPLAQMEAVRDLSRDILVRNHIPKSRVLAHSDIAPGRKTDPGPHFDWQWLAGEGVGLWPQAWTTPGVAIDVRKSQQQLADIGYNIGVTGEIDEQTRTVVSAFQLRWRNKLCDGVIDVETATRLTDVWLMLCAVG